MPNYEFIEHTSDIGVRVFGKSLEDLFKNCAEALFNIVIDFKPEKKIKEKIVLKAESLEEILITWLNELLSLFYIYKFLPVEYSLTLNKKNKLFSFMATIYGQNFESDLHKIKTEVKAATYHDLKIEKKDDLYIAEVIFDV
jgi:SHS2 domain-containing protein